MHRKSFSRHQPTPTAMKTSFLLLASCLFFHLPLSAQTYEFRTYDNGLIYDPSTMQQLHKIVDSLNLKFSSCELSKTYLSTSQARGHYLRLDKGNTRQARQDLKNNISLADFIKKYPNAILEQDLLIIKEPYTSYKGEQLIKFSSVPIGATYGHSITLDKDISLAIPTIGGWVYSQKDADKTLRAFYIQRTFTSTPLPERYARMVQYSNCLIDTTTQVFFEEAEKNSRWSRERQYSKAEEFVSYAQQLVPKPDWGTIEDPKEYERFYLAWLARRDSILDREHASNPEFKKRLKAATTDALQNGHSTDEFEHYVGRYYSAEDALKLKRSRKVVGSCSMDDSPRLHAVNIALLSAKTIKWEVFLRAHLDIMNDRFDRASDGSWAWAGRQTYIRELEALEINVPDLLLGISMRIENPSRHHYFGTIGRLGRAFAETQQAGLLEEKMQQLIRDPQLDDYNRMIAFYLYLNYIRHLPDKSRRKDNVAKLTATATSLPPYLSSRIDVRKLTKEE